MCNTNNFLLLCTKWAQGTKNKTWMHITYLNIHWQRRVGELIDALRVVNPAGGFAAHGARWAVAGASAGSQRRSRRRATPHSFQALRNPRRQKTQAKEEEKARKELRNPRWVDTDGPIRYYRDIILSDKSHHYVLKLFRDTSSSVEFQIEPIIKFQYIAVNIRFLLTTCIWRRRWILYSSHTRKSSASGNTLFFAGRSFLN